MQGPEGSSTSDGEQSTYDPDVSQSEGVQMGAEHQPVSDGAISVPITAEGSVPAPEPIPETAVTDHDEAEVQAAAWKPGMDIAHDIRDHAKMTQNILDTERPYPNSYPNPELRNEFNEGKLTAYEKSAETAEYKANQAADAAGEAYRAEHPEGNEQDKYKADLMTEARKAYDETADYFERAGDHQQAQKVRAEATEKAKQVAEQYEADRPEVEKQMDFVSSAVADAVMRFNRGEHGASLHLQIPLDLDDRIGQEVFDRTMKLLGLEQTKEEPIPHVERNKMRDNGEFRVFIAYPEERGNKVQLAISKIGDKPSTTNPEAESQDAA